MDLVRALAHQIGTGDVLLLVAVLLLVVTAGARVGALACSPPLSPKLVRASGISWQFGILLWLEQAYEFTRGQIPLNTDVALLNAYRLLDFEWRHGFFVEARVEHFFLQFGALMNAIDLFYALSHVLVTVGALVWVYIYRREHYPFIRNLLMLTTALALVVFYVYPTAPPRLLTNYGFVDPLQLHHLVGAGGAQPGSYTYNPYAAMPSLHVGYALCVACGLLRAGIPRGVRPLAVLYPAAMAITVVASGNHWVLDIVGACITVAISAAALALGGWLYGLTSALMSAPRAAIAESSYTP